MAPFHGRANDCHRKSQPTRPTAPVSLSGGKKNGLRRKPLLPKSFLIFTRCLLICLRARSSAHLTVACCVRHHMTHCCFQQHVSDIQNPEKSGWRCRNTNAQHLGARFGHEVSFRLGSHQNAFLSCPFPNCMDCALFCQSPWGHKGSTPPHPPTSLFSKACLHFCH